MKLSVICFLKFKKSFPSIDNHWFIKQFFKLVKNSITLSWSCIVLVQIFNINHDFIRDFYFIHLLFLNWSFLSQVFIKSVIKHFQSRNTNGLTFKNFKRSREWNPSLIEFLFLKSVLVFFQKSKFTHNFLNCSVNSFHFLIKCSKKVFYLCWFLNIFRFSINDLENIVNFLFNILIVLLKLLFHTLKQNFIDFINL